MSAPPSPLVGRERDLETLASWLAVEARLLTLVGPGGVGKSRLANEAAARFGARFEGGVARADLTRAHTAHELTRVVLESLGQRVRAPAYGPADTLEHRAPTLLVLDNLEHVVEIGAALIARCLSRAPQHTFLVTSQVPAHLGGERVHQVEPLRGLDARRLLTERILRVAPDTQLDPAVLDELARRLDGLPLALELAASRALVLSPPELLARLDDRFALLRGRRRDRDRRHATLASTIEWAFELLDEAQREALGACAVFTGSFDLEAAEATLPEGESPPLDRIQTLVERSLLVAERGPVGARFRLLESVREFVRSRSELDLEGARRRRDAFYLRRHAPEADAPLDLVSLDAGHLAAILREASPHERAAAALALSPLHAGAATRDEHLSLLDAGLDDARGERRLEALIQLAIARACAIADPSRARAALDDAADYEGPIAAFERRLASAFLRRHAGDLEGARAELEHAARGASGRRAARAAQDLAVVSMLAGRRADALASYQAAIEGFRASGDARAAAEVSGHLGVLALESDDALARAHLEAALQLHREAGDRRREGTVLGNLGVLEHQSGQLDAAEARWTEALAINRALGNRRFEAFSLAGLAAVLQERGELDEARASIGRSCELFASLHDPRWEGWARSRRGAVFAAMADTEAARADFAAARALLESAGGDAWLGAVDILEGRADDPRDTSSASRIARRLTRAAPLIEAPRAPGITVSEDGAFFEVTGERVDLSRRHALRRLLAALVQQRVEHPGDALSRPDLVAAGWPGERMRTDSGAARVYTAIRTLRKMGLEGTLISAHGGYALSKSVPLRVVEAREESQRSA